MKLARESVFALVDAAFRVVLGTVFIYAALSKLQDPAIFASAVAGYRMLPDPLVAAVAILLPPAELVAGAALILSKWQREAALIILGMLAVFLAGLVQAKVRGLDIGCGCFGADEGETVGDAIVRDILLLAPAVWLVVRGNRFAWSWKAAVPAAAAAAAALAILGAGRGPEANRPATVKADSPEKKPAAEKRIPKDPAAAVAEIFAQFPASGTNSVIPEVWTEDFPSALARSRAERKPLVMIVDSKTCPYCKRLATAMSGAGFENWMKGTGLYLARAVITSEDRASTNNTPLSVAMYKFLDDSHHEFKLEGYPYIGVYWEKPSGETVWTAFCGRHGLMGTEYRSSLACELANAIAGLLPDYMATLPPRPTEQEMIAATAKSISTAVEGEGRVHMTPADGTLLDNGKPVVLEAHPAKGWAFVGWRTPSGAIKKDRLRATKLLIPFSMRGGIYTAVFKPKARPANRRRPAAASPSAKRQPDTPPSAEPAQKTEPAPTDAAPKSDASPAEPAQKADAAPAEPAPKPDSAQGQS